VACLTLSAAARAGEGSDKPILSIDAGGHTKNVEALQFTPDDRELISTGDDNTIRIWDVQTGETRKVLRLPIYSGSGGRTAALSPDGRTLAVQCRGPEKADHWILLVSLSDGAITGSLKGHEDDVLALAFSPDGKRLASGSADRTARTWAVASGECERVLKGHRLLIYGVAFSPDGLRLATASGDGTGRIWSVETGKEETVFTDKERVYTSTSSVAWSPDGRTIATGHFAQRIKLWNLDGTLRQRLDPGHDCPFSVKFTADSRGVVAGGSVGCSIIDLQTGQVTAHCAEHRTTVLSTALSHDGKLAASGGGGGELYLWRTADGSVVHRLMGKGRALYRAAWSTDSQRVAWGSRNEVHRWWGNPASYKSLNPIERAFDLTALEFAEAPDKTMLRPQTTLGPLSVEVAKETGIATVISEGKAVQQLAGQWTTCYTFLPDGRLAVANALGIHFVEAKTGKHLRLYRAGGIDEVCASQDGRYLATASTDQMVQVWGPDSDDPLLSLFFAGDDWIAWTPEGYYAASPGGENLMGWRLNNGPDKLATFYPAALFHKSLYRPDVIKRLLEAGGVEKALAAADKARGEASQLAQVAEVLPPFVVITSPDRPKVEVQEPSVELRFVAKPVGKHPITAVRLLLDGRPYAGAEQIKKFDPPGRRGPRILDRQAGPRQAQPGRPGGKRRQQGGFGPGGGLLRRARRGSGG